MKASLKSYWGNLNERDRITLSVGIIVCGAYLLYLLIYSPLANAVHNKSNELLEKRETYAWMQQVRSHFQLKQPPKVLSSSKLLTVLAIELKSTSFKQFPYQLQQTGASDIQLSFEQVPYAAFVAWIGSINKKYTITIQQLNVDRTPTPGVVKLMMVIATK